MSLRMRVNPKCRRQVLSERLRKHLGEVFHRLAGQKEGKILEGRLLVDHVHMLISIPPKCAVAHVVGYIKGKSAIHIARTFGGRAKNFTGEHFWARGYYVSTVGGDEQAIREYIKKQQEEDSAERGLALDLGIGLVTHGPDSGAEPRDT